MVAFVCVTTVEPSPKSKLYEAMVSPGSGSLEFAPLKFTDSGAFPDVGEPDNSANGAAFGWHDAFPTIVYSPEGDKLSGQLSGVIATALTLMRNALSF